MTGVAEVPGLLEKEGRLRARLRELDGAVVALSGGVDSSLLAAVCAGELGGRALAVTAASEAVPDEEVAEAVALARHVGIAHRVVRTHELADPRYAANPADRCAFCKSELMDVLLPLGGGRAVLLGVNADDLADHRPGQEAARARGALFPLVDAGMGKADVRALARRLALPAWDRPAQPCLASRIPYGEAVTAGKLARIAAAERFVRREGFRDCRVRHHAGHASVEVPPAEMPRLLDPARWGRIEEVLLGLGFPRVEAAGDGLRSGRMNAALPAGAPSRRL